MGLATLNVWIHDRTDPCRIADVGFWYVSVSYCSGKPVEWCNQTYSGLTAKCGHAEFQLPPGCYVVGAFQFFPGIGRFNFTDLTIAVVGCDQTACIHLFTPTARHAVGAALLNVQQSADAQQLPGELAFRFAELANVVTEHLPQSEPDEAFEQLIRDLPAIVAKQPPDSVGTK